MYQLADVTKNTYGVLDTSDKTITYVTLTDLLRLIFLTPITITNTEKFLNSYFTSLEAKGTKIVIIPKNATLDLARAEMKKMEACDYKVFNFSRLKTMESLFSDCNALSLDLSLFDTSFVENMSNMFCNCKAKSLDLTGFHTNRVVDMSNMFKGCKATEIKVSKFDTRNVVTMHMMFTNCELFSNTNRGSDSINVNSFDISNVRDMYGMFSMITADVLNISNLNLKKVQDTYGMFAYSKINKLILGNLAKNPDAIFSNFDKTKCEIITNGK